jgi:hypothetical protein
MSHNVLHTVLHTMSHTVPCTTHPHVQFSLNLAFNGSAEIAAAGRYERNLRLLTVERVTSTTPETDAKLAQPWTVSSPAAVDDNKSFGVFSAECYLTGRKLLDLRPDVPIGVYHLYTSIEKCCDVAVDNIVQLTADACHTLKTVIRCGIVQGASRGLQTCRLWTNQRVLTDWLVD